jgi:hypothetical protein
MLLLGALGHRLGPFGASEYELAVSIPTSINPTIYIHYRIGVVSSGAVQ